MPLKIELKPKEKIIIGDALITNDNERIKFYIEGNVPILREKFIMRQDEADTPSKRVYFIILQMYLNKDNKELQDMYLEYVKDLQSAAPSLIPEIMEVNQYIIIGDYYGALKSAGKLLKREDELFGEYISGAKSI